MPAQDPKAKAIELIESAKVNGEAFDADALFDEFKANGKPFVFRGERFILPEPTTWPEAAMNAAMNADGAETARLVLGDDDFERFVKAGGNSLFLERLVAKLHGASLGESSASSSS